MAIRCRAVKAAAERHRSAANYAYRSSKNHPRPAGTPPGGHGRVREVAGHRAYRLRRGCFATRKFQAFACRGSGPLSFTAVATGLYTYAYAYAHFPARPYVDNGRYAVVGERVRHGGAVFVMPSRCHSAGSAIRGVRCRRPVVTPDGMRVAALGGSDRNIRGKLQRTGNDVNVSSGVSLGSSQRFVRGIHKIALGVATCFLGTDAVLGVSFDAVRSYVRNGTGKRRIVARPTEDDVYRNVAWPSYKYEAGLAVVLRLAMIELYVDLSPDQNGLSVLVEKLKASHGNRGWTLMPFAPCVST